jgi:hypothetical protein
VSFTTSRVFLFLLLLAPAGALAQRRGGGAPPPRQAPQMTADEKERAQTAAEWKDMIERARNSLPQHPPDKEIKFPSKNATFLVTLRYAENPRGDLEKYMGKLWGDASDKRWALDNLWQEAEKPVWARAAIEDFFKRRAGAGVALHVVPEVAKVEPAKVAAAPEPARPAPEPAALVASPAPKSN